MERADLIDSILYDTDSAHLWVKQKGALLRHIDWNVDPMRKKTHEKACQKSRQPKNSSVLYINSTTERFVPLGVYFEFVLQFVTHITHVVSDTPL